MADDGAAGSAVGKDLGLECTNTIASVLVWAYFMNIIP